MKHTNVALYIGLSLSCVKCTYLSNVDLSQITDAPTLAVMDGVISSSYSAASCNTATLGSSATQVSDATCQEPSDTVRSGCLNITGSLIFTELVGLPGVHVTSDVVHRDCANQTDWESGCHIETKKNMMSIPWNSSFTLLHTLVSAGEFTGQVCITDIHRGASITETPEPLMLTAVLVLHILSSWRLL
ncbi:uncharacterized protein LOC128156851 [Crassostrea angulata]|uniref:uncharacterized protein LOC128156851 n=1 Tax=Magallana angulata TaxID=2784310 RepID=UPI0022B0FC04|nr:uncharacterized protein LOC128156851 [Crassostrea angulata]